MLLDGQRSLKMKVDVINLHRDEVTTERKVY